MILPNGADVEGAPNILGMCILFILEVMVVELGNERLLGWQMVVCEFLHAIQLLARKDALQQE